MDAMYLGASTSWEDLWLRYTYVCMYLRAHLHVYKHAHIYTEDHLAPMIHTSFVLGSMCWLLVPIQVLNTLAVTCWVSFFSL